MINGPAKHFIVAEYYTHSNQRKKYYRDSNSERNTDLAKTNFNELPCCRQPLHL